VTQPETIPVVLTFSGNDPSGGAGVQADIESLASMGCHCAPVITALTVQNTEGVLHYQATEPDLIIEQARAVLEDMPVSAIKIGMIGSAENGSCIHTILTDYPEIPVVLDPVLSGGQGGTLSSKAVVDAISSLLIPLTTLLTPNSEEARILAPNADNLNACAQELLEMGSEFVLITGTHENTPEVENRLYGQHRHLETFTWERLPGSYHGSGCTLAAATAGLLAQGLEPFAAAHEAQEYAWETLQHGYRLGMGQRLPNRFFWARGEEE